MQFDMDTSCTVNELKAKIQDKEGLPRNAFCLRVDGVRTQGIRTLAHYKLTDQKSVQLVLESNVDSSSAQARVLML